MALSEISDQLKTDLISCCLVFKYNNYTFSYKTIQVLPTEQSDSIKKEIKILMKKYEKINNILIFLKQLGLHFDILITFLYYDQKFSSQTIGRELFVRQNKHLFWFHSNAGKIVKLPAGVGKLQGCLHRLDDIINFTKDEKNTKLVHCPLHINANFRRLEKKYQVSLEVWTKKKLTTKTFDIKKVRTAKKFKNKIQLHCDLETGKLFLIRDSNLYFRGYLKKLCN